MPSYPNQHPQRISQHPVSKYSTQWFLPTPFLTVPKPELLNTYHSTPFFSRTQTCTPLRISYHPLSKYNAQWFLHAPLFLLYPNHHSSLHPFSCCTQTTTPHCISLHPFSNCSQTRTAHCTPFPAVPELAPLNAYHSTPFLAAYPNQHPFLHITAPLF